MFFVFVIVFVFVFVSVYVFVIVPIKLRHLCRCVFLHLHRCVDNAKDKDSSSDIERPFHGVGYNARGGYAGYSNGREQVREHIPHKTTSIAKERLDTISLGFLLLVHHVAHHHLEWLHRHIDTGVEKHQRDESEGHGTHDGNMQVTSIGQQAHHRNGKCRTDKQIRNTTTETRPCLITKQTHQWLYHHTHQWRKYPEIAEVMWVGTQSGKDTRDIRTLQRICYLYSEEAEAQVPQLGKRKIWFLSHFYLYQFQLSITHITHYLVVPRTMSRVLTTLFSILSAGMMPST